MSENNWRQITLVRGPIWGMHSLTLIISCCELLTVIHRLGLSTCLSCKNPALFTEVPSSLIRFQTKTELFCSAIFQNDLRPHLSFSYRFRPSTLQSWSREKPHSSVCLHSSVCHGRVVWRTVVSILMTSPFSDRVVFSVHTRKQRFQKASFSNRSTLESVLELLRFRWSFSEL